MSDAQQPASNVTLDEAWAMLGDGKAVLIDVRTHAEWSFVGVPDLGSLGTSARFVEWTRYPDGARNPDFVAEAAADLPEGAVVLCICRSGARSAAAAAALLGAGVADVRNVVAGFEGDLDGAGHRHGGWKDHLPWRQG